MQCVIMAAGKGMRMRPLTLATPKPLLEVAGRPIVEWTIRQLPEEITEIIFVVSWLKEQFIERYASGVGGRRVAFVEQTEAMPQGTAGAVLAAKRLLHGRFMALNGDDIYGAADLAELLRHDRAIAAKPAEKTGRFGVLCADVQGNLSAIEEAGDHPTGSLINIGAYVLDEHFFSYDPVIIPNGEFGLPHTVAMMAKGFPVRIVQAETWIPFGNPEDLAAGAALVKSAGL